MSLLWFSDCEIQNEKYHTVEHNYAKVKKMEPSTSLLKQCDIFPESLVEDSCAEIFVEDNCDGCKILQKKYRSLKLENRRLQNLVCPIF